MKEVARGTAAITCLPSKDELNTAYFELRARIDQIDATDARATFGGRWDPCPTP